MIANKSSSLIMDQNNQVLVQDINQLQQSVLHLKKELLDKNTQLTQKDRQVQQLQAQLKLLQTKDTEAIIAKFKSDYAELSQTHNKQITVIDELQKLNQHQSEQMKILLKQCEKFQEREQQHSTAVALTLSNAETENTLLRSKLGEMSNKLENNKISNKQQQDLSFSISQSKVEENRLLMSKVSESGKINQNQQTRIIELEFQVKKYQNQALEYQDLVVQLRKKLNESSQIIMQLNQEGNLEESRNDELAEKYKDLEKRFLELQRNYDAELSSVHSIKVGTAESQINMQSINHKLISQLQDQEWSLKQIKAEKSQINTQLQKLKAEHCRAAESQYVKIQELEQQIRANSENYDALLRAASVKYGGKIKELEAEVARLGRENAAKQQKAQQYLRDQAARLQATQSAADQLPRYQELCQQQQEELEAALSQLKQQKIEANSYQNAFNQLVEAKTAQETLVSDLTRQLEEQQLIIDKVKAKEPDTSGIFGSRNDSQSKMEPMVSLRSNNKLTSSSLATYKKPAPSPVVKQRMQSLDEEFAFLSKK